MALKFTNHEYAMTVIDRLSKLLGVNEKGEVTIGSIGSIGGLQTATDILATFIDFSPHVIELQRRRITHRAVLDAKKSGDFTAKSILATIEGQQKAYLQKPIRKFVLLTSASFQFSEQLKTIRLNDSTLTFSQYRPKDYPLPDGGSLILKDNTPGDYCYVKVHVSARDAYEAVDLAFGEIDLLRALWNLYFNLEAGIRMTFGSSGHKPINRILPGPLHTLHDPAGKLALSEWLYTPLAKDSRGERLDVYYKKMRRFEKAMLRRIAVCKFRDKLASFLVRYVRALDESDMSTSFLKLWSLLEEITGTERQSYDVTVRRASFVFRDPHYLQIVLGFLRDQRNRTVHKGVQLDDPERLAYELKSFVEALLKFVLAESKRLVGVQAFHSLLDISPDPNLLRNRLSLHRLAYRLHRQGKK